MKEKKGKTSRILAISQKKKKKTSRNKTNLQLLERGKKKRKKDSSTRKKRGGKKNESYFVTKAKEGRYIRKKRTRSPKSAKGREKSSLSEEREKNAAEIFSVHKETDFSKKKREG